MASRNQVDLKRYLLLINDLCITRTQTEFGSTRRFDSFNGVQYLKGTILEEIPITPPSSKLTCVVIDSNDIIECDENDVDPLTIVIKDHLIAISNCKERYEVFRNKKRLCDGLEMKPGCDVIVRLSTVPGEVLGKLRYKGKLVDRDGTYFGVELISARQKGNSNGTLKKIKYFACTEDCGVFLALNRVTSKEYNNLMQAPVPAPRKVNPKNISLKTAESSYATVPSQGNAIPSVINIDENELDQLNINIGMEVYIFTEVHGNESQERGTVRFLGRLHELPTDDIYAGIELVNPSGNGRGVFNKRQLFKTKLNHAALVPLSGVLPASTFDHTSHKEESKTSSNLPLQKVSSKITRSKEATDQNAFSGPEYFTSKRLYFKPPNRNVIELPIYSKGSFNSNLQHSSSGNGTVAELDDDLYSHDDIYSGQSIVDRERLPRNQIQSLYPLTTASSKQDYQSENTSNDCNGLEIGSMVEILDGIESQNEVLLGPVFGVIRWIGKLPNMQSMEIYAGVELEIERDDLTDGEWNGSRYFNCSGKRALFVPIYCCQKDSRFTAFDDVLPLSSVQQQKSCNFGDFKAPQVKGCVEPPKELTLKMLGKGKGIQGHYNSCYLDSMLFSLFAYSYCLDSLLLRRKQENDLPEYQQVQQVLKEFIVNPLRTQNFVRADKIMELRKHLDALSSVTGLTNEEKDPEEFLQTLLNHVFKAEPLIELRQGNSDHTQECHFYQIFTDKDEKMVLPSTQLLLEQSFLASDLKFREVPVCLILQMPRFGKDYRMYNRVRPSLSLDVTDMVERLPRNCTVCGGLAEYECKQCSVERSMQEHISSYCEQCAKICHQHPMRKKHSFKKMDLPDEYRSFIAHEGERPAVRHKLELYAVVCIETSHYVSFAKCGKGRNAKWCFFDSMADRVGEQSGYNIPAVTHCEQFEDWLKTDTTKLLEMDQREMPEYMRRLLCDAYLCLYQSSEMMFYT